VPTRPKELKKGRSVLIPRTNPEESSVVLENRGLHAQVLNEQGIVALEQNG
jgi:hypothetical protein